MIQRWLWSLSGALLLAACKRNAPAPPDASTTDPVAASPEAMTPRCSPLSEDTFVLGDRDPGDGRAPSRLPASQPSADRGPAQDDLLPFAAEVGDAVTYADGFALGALRHAGSALEHVVITLDPRGGAGKIIPLGVARGEAEPARVAAHGRALVTGILEPEADGRALRLARIAEGRVTWGATVHEKTGESQAFDIGLGDAKGIVVWDEDGPERSSIEVATFDAASLGALTTPRSISSKQSDCESPRLTTRPGGFWLTYIARSSAEEDSDARYSAEDIGYRWLETVSLDVNGSPTGPARAVSARDGHVLVFDVASGPDDGVVVIFREDDTPSGSAGGSVMRTVVRPNAVDPVRVVDIADVGAGVPSLVGGWLAVLDGSDSARLGPISSLGELRAPLTREPAIGSGEPLAAGPEGLLIARSSGLAIKLSVVRCIAPAL